MCAAGEDGHPVGRGHPGRGSTITPRLCTWAGRQVSTDSSEGPSVKRSRDLAGPGLQKERRGGTGAPGREVAPALTLLCTSLVLH